MKAGESMRRNFAQILKDAKIDIKVEYQKLYGMLYDRSIQVSNTNRISVYDELSTFFIAFHFRGIRKVKLIFGVIIESTFNY